MLLIKKDESMKEEEVRKNALEHFRPSFGLVDMTLVFLIIHWPIILFTILCSNICKEFLCSIFNFNLIYTKFTDDLLYFLGVFGRTKKKLNKILTKF